MPKRRRVNPPDAQESSVVTRSMAATRASITIAKALGTTEVLEHILAYLPTKTIIEVQLVCKQWRAVIQTSPTLRRRRLLDPDSASDTTLIAASEYDAKLHSMAEVFASMPSVWTLHPLFQSQLPVIITLSSIPTKFLLTKPALQGMLSWREGRWEDTFVTQPPATKMKLQIERINGIFVALGTYTIERSDGLRLGLLVDKLVEMLNHDDSARSDRVQAILEWYQEWNTKLYLQLM